MRILSTVFILLIVFAVIGWFRGWFIVESASAAQTAPRVIVDSGKVADDARAAADKIGAKLGELSAKATRIISDKKSLPADGSLSIEGRVTSVELSPRRINLRFGGDDLSLDVPDATPITVGGTSHSLGDLSIGQTVQIGLRAEGSRLLLQSIEAK